MSPPAPPPGEQPAAKPGKIRTWWHPLLASLLRWQLGSHYHLEEEVPVGQKPLQIDLLLLHKEQGELPASARQILAGLVEYLGEFTLVEFKSPSDTLRAGDFQTFLAYALLYRAQNQPLLEPSKLHLLVIAPRLTRPYRDELQILGATAQQEAPGIWRLQGGPVVHATWVLETETLAGLGHPLVTLISPQFLEKRLETYDLLRQGGYTKSYRTKLPSESEPLTRSVSEAGSYPSLTLRVGRVMSASSKLVVYLAQQIYQFHLCGKEFAMQHLGADKELVEVMRDIWETMSDEDRLDILAHTSMGKAFARLPPEVRLEGLTAEERLRGLAPEQRLRGLSPEELDRLRRLLQQPPPKEGDPSTPK